MKPSIRFCLFIAFASAGTSHAQVPSSNDTSDAFQNTGMGTGALKSVTSPSLQTCGSAASGCANTAAGYQALLNNAGMGDGFLSGSFNTAFGDGALTLNAQANYNTAVGYAALNSNNGYGCGPAVPENMCASQNTATGYEALYSNQQGSQNTAIGAQALYSNSSLGAPGTQEETSGIANTGVGYQALYANLAGGSNTAVGSQALYSNTSVYDAATFGYTQGQWNTALGNLALFSNTTGSYNTGVGYQALQGLGSPARGTGSYNTAMGVGALFSFSTGSDNVASGYEALYRNTTGLYNTAAGYATLFSNTNGVSNVASGYEALYANTAGNYNTATGTNALSHNTTGSSNTSVGYHAGANLTTGSNNIDIGNQGVAGDNATLRVGTQGAQSATYIAGIYGHSLTGSTVVVTSSGELGVIASSERFKTAVAPMGAGTEKLEQLRPVTFRLRADATGTRQYGLIAEEVAKVYPELVIRNESGRIDGVRYDELAPMLLNEVQKQAGQLRSQDAELQSLSSQVKEMREMLARFERSGQQSVQN